MGKPKAPPVPREATRTRRQELRAALIEGPISFEGLREIVRESVRDLEDDLRHLDRSLAKEEKLCWKEAFCVDCEFGFRGRIPKHFHAPGRCPRCRGQRIADPVYWIEEQK